VISFGNDGWVAKISEEFTFDNVRRVGRVAAACLTGRGLPAGPFIVSYDPRFLADRFAVELAKTLESAGISVLLTERDTPTPVVAWEMNDKKAVGAVVVTAGSRDRQFGGLKFLGDIAREIGQYLDRPAADQVKKGSVERFEPRERYYRYLSAQLDQAKIKKAAPLVVVDPFHGSARGYVDLFLQRLGCRVEELHSERDVLFGGGEPSPIEERLGELRAKVAALKADIGLAFNADASAYALIGRDGRFQAGESAADPILAAFQAVEKLSSVV
jgi:phosphomannomutase